MADVIEFRVRNGDLFYYDAIVRNKVDHSWNNSGCYVRESDYNALMHDKLAIESRVNQLVDNHNALDAVLRERDKQLIVLLEASKEVVDWCWPEILRYADVQDDKPLQDLMNLTTAIRRVKEGK